MSTIAEAGNLYNPCLVVLKSRGYRLSTEEGENTCYWIARTDSHEFAATSPMALLGITSMWETLGDEWNSAEQEDILDNVFATDANNDF